MKNAQRGFIGVAMLIVICLAALSFGGYEAYKSLKTSKGTVSNIESQASTTFNNSTEAYVVIKKEISPKVTTNIQTQASINLPKRLYTLAGEGVTVLDSSEINAMNISGLIVSPNDTGVKMELTGRIFVYVADIGNPNSIGKLYEIKDNKASTLYESGNSIIIFLDDENKIYVLDTTLDKSTQPVKTIYKLYLVKEKLELLSQTGQTIVICLSKACTLGSFRTITY